jgi:hypothetical protein
MPDHADYVARLTRAEPAGRDVASQAMARAALARKMERSPDPPDALAANSERGQ